jgi:class 3 adenylate cyclase
MALSVFTDAHAAVHAAADLQRDHQLTLARWAEPMRMAIRIGVATGEVVELEGDTYGDAVNVASRLCERAVPARFGSRRHGRGRWCRAACAFSAAGDV